MRLIFNLIVMAAFVFLLFGEEPFENMAANIDKGKSFFKSQTVTPPDGVEAKINALMRAIDSEVNDPKTEELLPIGGDTRIQESREDSAEITEKLSQKIANQAANVSPPVGDQHGSETVPASQEQAERLDSNSGKLTLISLADRAYAIDQLIYELEENAYR